MPNEVTIVIDSQDHSAAGVNSAVKRQQQLRGSVDEVGKTLEKNKTQVHSFGSALGTANRVGAAGVEVAKGLAGGALAAGAAFAVANRVLNEGIGIKLAEANAQTALGDSYGKLEAAANSQAHQLGLTTSEYTAAAGQTAALAKNMGFAQETAANFGMLMPDLSNKLSIMSNGQRSAAETSDMMRAAMAGEFDPLQTVGINISALIVQQKALAIQQANGSKFTEQQANALAVLSIVQEQTADTTKTLSSEAGKAAREAAQNSAEMRQAWQDLEESSVPVLSKVTKAFADALQSYMNLKDSFTEGGIVEGLDNLMHLSPLTSLLDRAIGRTKDQGEASAEAAPKIDDLAKADKGAGKSAETLAKETAKATKEIEDQADAALNARDANRGFQEAIDEAADALKENGKTLNINTEAGRNNEKALDAIAEAAHAQAQAVLDAGGSEDEFRMTLNESRGALVRAATQFGMTKKQAEAYATSVLGIPKTATTSVNAIIRGALNSIETVRVKMARLNGTTAWVHVRATESQSIEDIVHGRGEHAYGGVVSAWAGQAAAAGGIRSGGTLVGERGWEILDLPPGTRVTSHADSVRRMTESTGRSGPVDVMLHVSSDDPALLSMLRRMVRAYGGRGTDSVQVAFGGSGG